MFVRASCLLSDSYTCALLHCRAVLYSRGKNQNHSSEDNLLFICSCTLVQFFLKIVTYFHGIKNKKNDTQFCSKKSLGLCLKKITNCLFVGCLTSQQHASVSQGRICTDNFTCCHTEIEVADPTFYLTQSQYTDTGPTSSSADPITPGA